MNSMETLSAPVIEHDWRFADLVLHALIDPALTDRYRRDPWAVLAEFGIQLDTGEQPPALPTADAGPDLRVERLDDSASTAFFTLCWVDETPRHDGVPSGR